MEPNMKKEDFYLRNPPISGYYVLVFSRIQLLPESGIQKLLPEAHHFWGFKTTLPVLPPFFWEGLMEGKSEQPEKPYFFLQ